MYWLLICEYGWLEWEVDGWIGGFSKGMFCVVLCCDLDWRVKGEKGKGKRGKEGKRERGKRICRIVFRGSAGWRKRGIMDMMNMDIRIPIDWCVNS